MTTIFGNPGSTELPMFRSFPNDFRYIVGLQEAAVVGMADGYAQVTRNAALVNLHSAVGVGHAMGAIFTAYKNRTPLVITAGQQARSILPTEPFLFSMQATELPKPYVKWSNEPARAEDVPGAIALVARLLYRFPSTIGTGRPSSYRLDKSALRCAAIRICWRIWETCWTVRRVRHSWSDRVSTVMARGIWP
jgi:thiamine pyrophosphate-dependent acetolactate synthase large subunit-like protein